MIEKKVSLFSKSSKTTNLQAGVRTITEPPKNQRNRRLTESDGIGNLADRLRQMAVSVEFDTSNDRGLRILKKSTMIISTSTNTETIKKATFSKGLTPWLVKRKKKSRIPKNTKT
jgi:hypothetical protein